MYTSTLRNIARARSLNWNNSLIWINLLVATYLYVEDNFYIVLNQCEAETEMLLNFCYLLIIQGELCWLDYKFY